MTAPDARAAQAAAQTAQVAAPGRKLAVACPRCGNAVPSEASDFCEACSAHLYPGHCVFCLEPFASGLAPPPPPSGALGGPAMPPPPAHLCQDAAGLGPLPGRSVVVSTLPHRFMMAGIIPVVAAAVLTLLGLIISWPATGTLRP